MSDYELVVDVRNKLGEGPLWVAREQKLYWLDITGKQVFRYDPVTTLTRCFDVEPAITVLGMRQGGGFVAGTVDGFAFWDPAQPGRAGDHRGRCRGPARDAVQRWEGRTPVAASGPER